MNRTDELRDCYFTPGQKVGDYSIGEMLGRGGMGVVYYAHHPYRGHVAVKILKRGMDTGSLIRRFRLEREVLRRLEHPNIARLIDAGSTDCQLPYIVMEYIPGRPLHHYADHKQLSVDRRLELFVEVCRAVSDAHKNLVVHRDLKPHNILVTDAGVPKLLDFGIARLVDEESGEAATVTAAGTRMLTPEYASPEQLRGEPAAVTCDVYSLGVVLYELLTGHRPGGVVMTRSRTSGTDGSDITLDPARIGEVRENTPKRPRGKLNGDLNRIMLKALHKDRERRYPTVAALADDINRYLSGRPVEARGDSILYKAQKLVQRHKTVFLTAASMVLVLGGLSIGRLAGVSETRKEQELAQLNMKAFNTVITSMEPLLEGYRQTQRAGKSRQVIAQLDNKLSELRTVPVEQLVEAGLGRTLTMLSLRTGEVYCGLYQHERALDTFFFARDLAAAMGDRRLEASALTWIAAEYGDQDQHGELGVYAEQAMALLKGYEEQWPADTSFALSILARYQVLTGDRGEGMCNMRRAYELSKGQELGLLGETVVTRVYALLSFYLGRQDQAADLLDDLIPKLEERASLEVLSAMKQVKSLSYWHQGLADEAIRIQEQAWAHTLEDPFGEHQAPHYQALVAGLYLRSGQLETAENLLSTLPTGSKSDLYFTQLRGRLAMLQGHPEKAMKHYRILEGKWPATMHQVSLFVARFYMDYAAALTATGRPAKAEDFLNRTGRAIADNMPEHDAHMIYAWRRAQLAAARGRNAEAKTWFAKATGLGRDYHRHYPEFANVLTTYAAFEAAAGRTENAAQLHREAAAIRENAFGPFDTEVEVGDIAAYP
ncbi:MAG: serine/threonine-protein kinase [Acidobacteriota bacterium]|nr:serine/threonine-protein kinase [Acidobacteriota bacterium]